MGSGNDLANRAVATAEIEMEYRVALFNRMTESCFKKCMDKKYREGDLNLGETTCVDRCCHKYWQATAIVGQLLGVYNSQNQ